MKLTWKQIEPFVKNPDPKARVILVYGPDDGLMRERAAIMGKTIVADLNDPFNAVTLSADSLIEDPARLADEACALSMMGGARLIRIEDGADKITPLIKEYLNNPSAQNLVIIEAGDLGKKSPLRALCEKAGNAAALPCYIEEERSIAGFIRAALQEQGYKITSDAAAWLAGAVIGDRGRVRREIEKLAIYMGAEKEISITDVQACCGEAGVQSLDNLVFSAGGGRPEAALKSYEVLLGEGMPVIAILRVLQNHFRRLHLTKARIENGIPVEQAMKMLTPPVFYKFEEMFATQTKRWSASSLEAIMNRLAQIEAQTKQSGTPVETLCAQALLSISAR